MRGTYCVAAGLVVLMALVAGCSKPNPQIARLEDENQQLKKELSGKDYDIAQIRKEYEAKEKEYALGGSSMKALRDELAAAKSYITKLEAQVGGRVDIPEVAAAELEAIARANPDLMEFDRESGVLRFKEAINFASGQFVISDKSKAVIDKVAGVLKTIQNVRFRVDGHTDTDPIVKTPVKSNMELSLRRAAAVWLELEHAGVSPDLMYCAGFGEFKPLASADNKTNEGKARNRRVEVLILGNKK